MFCISDILGHFYRGAKVIPQKLQKRFAMGNLISIPDLLGDKDNAREELGFFGLLARTRADIKYLCCVGFDSLRVTGKFIDISEYVFQHPFDPQTGDEKGRKPNIEWLAKVEETKAALKKRVADAAGRELVVKEGFIVDGHGREIHVLVMHLSGAHLEPWTDEYKSGVKAATDAWEELVTGCGTWRHNSLCIESKEEVCGMFMVKENYWSKDAVPEERIHMLA